MLEKLHCPICADKMIVREDHYYCQQGECGLPEIVKDEIVKVLYIPQSTEEIADAKEMETFFCPKCGEPLFSSKERKMIFCQDCKIGLSSKAIYHLVEHTAHKYIAVSVVSG